MFVLTSTVWSSSIPAISIKIILTSTRPHIVSPCQLIPRVTLVCSCCSIRVARIPAVVTGVGNHPILNLTIPIGRRADDDCNKQKTKTKKIIINNCFEGLRYSFTNLLHLKVYKLNACVEEYCFEEGLLLIKLCKSPEMITGSHTDPDIDPFADLDEDELRIHQKRTELHGSTCAKASGFALVYSI